MIRTKLNLVQQGQPDKHLGWTWMPEGDIRIATGPAPEQQGTIILIGEKDDDPVMVVGKRYRAARNDDHAVLELAVISLNPNKLVLVPEGAIGALDRALKNVKPAGRG